MGTPFELVYDTFLSKITDDMYMELTERETNDMLEELLIPSIYQFEFPRVDLSYEKSFVEDQSTYCGIDSDNEEVICFIYGGGYFYSDLNQEEINILATYMVAEWLGQQLASIENVREKYSGSDFKFTSQANHMAKVLALKKNYEKEGFHLQRLYKRRKKDNESGIYLSTLVSLRGEDI